MSHLSAARLKGKIKEIWTHAGFQKYFQNMGWIFFARIGNLILSFVATAYIARHLGPSNYGELSYAVSFVSLFSFIAALGIDQVLYRDLIKYPDQKDKYMGSAMTLRLCSSVIAILFCLGFAVFLSPKDVSLYLIFLLSISFIFNSFQLISYEFQASVKAKYPSLQSLVITLILNVLKIVVVIMGEGIIYLAFILLLESVFYAIGFIYYRTKLFGTIRTWSFDKAIARQILRDSWPLIFSSAFALVYARIDQIMIKNMLDATSVGFYDAAVRLSEAWYFIPSIIASSLFPAIINSKNSSHETYHKRILRLALLLLVLSIVIAVPVTLLAEPIIRIIFGPAFVGAILVLQIYIWSNIFTSLNTVVNLYLVAENYKRTLFWSALGGMVANIALNTYLIPRFGISGAALATLISYAVPSAFIFLPLRNRKLPPQTEKAHVESVLAPEDTLR